MLRLPPGIAAEEIRAAVEAATAHWDAHRHPFVWGPSSPSSATPPSPVSPGYQQLHELAGCTIERGSRISLEKQFVRAVREAIGSWRLRSGMRLPSTRRLAADTTSVWARVVA